MGPSAHGARPDIDLADLNQYSDMNRLVNIAPWGSWVQVVTIWLVAAAIISALVAIQVMLKRKFMYLIPWPTNSNAIAWLLRFLWREAPLALIGTAIVVLSTIGATVYIIALSHR